jgi:hypothetical protein
MNYRPSVYIIVALQRSCYSVLQQHFTAVHVCGGVHVTPLLSTLWDHNMHTHTHNRSRPLCNGSSSCVVLFCRTVHEDCFGSKAMNVSSTDIAQSTVQLSFAGCRGMLQSGTRLTVSASQS